jgi:hypothetical protein
VRKESVANGLRSARLAAACGMTLTSMTTSGLQIAARV